VKEQNEIQAMNKDLLKHTVGLVQSQSTTEMKDRRNVLDLDMLSMYGQDDLFQSVFVVGETFAELALQNHFLH
jgi:hypothetical protein